MAMGNGCDKRYSSFASDIDAAIERVVTHFEDSDIALRLDVLRSLSVHAKLAFETERITQRLHQHPVTKELIECVTTQSTVFERLFKSLAVEDYSCEYDRQRNVEMQASIRWQLGPESSSSTKKKSKRRRTRDTDTPLHCQYKFTRTLNDDGETVVVFTITVSVGGDAPLKQLVRFEMASDAPYPRSFYEEDHEMDSDEEDEGGVEEEQPTTEAEPSDDEEEEDVEGGEEDGVEGEDGEQMDDDKDPYGEQIRGFEFDDEVLDTICDWLNAEDEELDPADIIGFFLALPIYEDDWMIDERICQILFNAGGSQMEEEIVSNFDDEEEGEGGEDENVEVADLD